MHRFYVSDALDVGSETTLSGQQAHQIQRVLRLGVGQVVALFNGDSREIEAKIVRIETGDVIVQVESAAQPDTELGYRLEVAIALLRGEKMDWVVQKLTEVGVSEIVLVNAGRSVGKIPADQRDRRLTRLASICREAAEQSGRVRLPEIKGPVNACGLSLETSTDGIVLDPFAERCLVNRLHGMDPRTVGALRLVVGPEGGWSPAELSHLIDQGHETAGLGPRVLRSETAAVLAAGLAAQLLAAQS